MTEKGRYDKRGVSSQKEDVHKAISRIDKGIFPNAFCKVVEDALGSDPAYCNVMHADGAGTKSSLAYLYWKETGDLSVWKGIAVDAVVMNLDDMLCLGITGPFLMSNTIGRNKHLIPGEVIREIIEGMESFCSDMRKLGIELMSTGGETADVGDLVRTVMVDSTFIARVPRKNVLSVNIQPGDVIVGIASYGQATYENAYNAGMGSNGLTSARHDLLHHQYLGKYPETVDPNTDKSVVYSGKYKVTDMAKGLMLDMGKSILSPTRTYAPLIMALQPWISEMHGIIHCTGGGQTKVLKFCGDDVHIIKDKMLPVPPLFNLIQEESGAGWKEMFEVFNMGHRLEFYVPADVASVIIEKAAELGLEAGIVGHVAPSSVKQLTVLHNSVEFIWR